MKKSTYKVVADRKFGFKKLLQKFTGKKNIEQDRETEKKIDKLPDSLKIVVGKADNELLSGKSAVVEIGGYDGVALKNAMESYNKLYGTLPKEIYELAVGDIEGYLKKVMEGNLKNGINTLAEIEQAIKARNPFIGLYAKGISEDGEYKIYVEADLIYDSKRGVFDSEWKRLQKYSEIQHMVATHIYNKDLKTIRKECKKSAER